MSGGVVVEMYTTYEFYSKVYKGNATEEVFHQCIADVTQYLRMTTLKKADAYIGEELEYATCGIVDIYVNFDDKKSRVVSENTDGYVVTYQSEGNTGETAEQVRDRKAYAVARKWLLGTGLLSRKCGHL